MKKYLYLFSVIIFLFCGCAGPKVISTPSKKDITPAKKIPSKAKVPGTQRPYKINGKTYYPLPSSHGFRETGLASWYGRPFHGRKTSNGETYNMYGQSAAHKTLPMNTMLLVENLENNREMVLRVNDRGPFVKGRIIDLSFRAAQKLDVVKTGTARVRITALGEAMTYQQGNKKIERFLPHADFQSGDFFIQIGSFTVVANADRLQKKILNSGRKCVVKRYDRGDAVFYRVQVRGGTTLGTARRMEKIMVDGGYPDAFVVAR